MNDISLMPVVRRWWWALLLGAVFAGAAGYVAASKLPKIYTDQATLLVGPINTDVALDASSSLTATYEALATSRPVLQSAIAATGARLTPDQLALSASSTSNTVSRLVTVTVSSRDNGLAARLANAIASRLGVLARTDPAATNASIQSFDSQPEISPLGPAILQRVNGAIQKVFGGSPAGSITVVQAAEPAASPSSPQKSLLTALGAVVGLLIVTLLVLIRDARGRSAADEHSLAELDHAYLGSVDVSSIRDSTTAVSVESRPTSRAAGDYRMLAARLSLDDRAQTTRSVLVVDSTDGSAASGVAANLAAALKRTTDRSVLLADVSTELVGATKLFGLQGHRGYSELIATPDLDSLNGHLNDFVVDRGEEVRVLPQGKSDGADVRSADRARSLLRRLAESADLVVLSGPPPSRSPSGLIWARAAESVLFVVDGSKASHDDVIQAVRDLSLANDCFLGTVIGRRRSTFPGIGRAVAGRA